MKNILINGSICPSEGLLKEVSSLKQGETLVKGETIIAMCLTADLLESFGDTEDSVETIETTNDILQIENTWDVFNLNGAAIQQDFELLTKDANQLF